MLLTEESFNSYQPPTRAMYLHLLLTSDHLSVAIPGGFEFGKARWIWEYHRTREQMGRGYVNLQGKVHDSFREVTGTFSPGNVNLRPSRWSYLMAPSICSLLFFFPFQMIYSVDTLDFHPQDVGLSIHTVIWCFTAFLGCPRWFKFLHTLKVEIWPSTLRIRWRKINDISAFVSVLSPKQSLSCKCWWARHAGLFYRFPQQECSIVCRACQRTVDV